jgi:5-methylcytosine-specific restriction protein A
MAKNPPWSRDELILALDLYFQVNPLHASEKHPEIRGLSTLLNRLPGHTDAPDAARYRNPNGVYMKLCNFLRFDPDYEGTGLTRGGKLEAEIWKEFASDRPLLESVAKAIRLGISKTPKREILAPLADDDEVFQEGALLTAMHKRRERNPGAVRRKKQAVMAAVGRLACEACGFDFREEYGELGEGFIECHHRVPLAALPSKRSVALRDLALVCANCHRMLHRSRPMMTVEQLAMMSKSEA